MQKGRLKKWLVRIGVALPGLVFILVVWIATDLNLPVKTEMRRLIPEIFQDRFCRVKASIVRSGF